MRGVMALSVVLVLASSLAGCLGEDGLPGRIQDAATRLAGCTDLSGVANDMGSFSYGGVVTCKTASESYDWQNAAPVAQVEWGGAYAGGSLNVSILDAADRVVHEFSIDGSGARGGSGSTDFGVPGPIGFTWTIELEFREFTGTMGLTVDSA